MLINTLVIIMAIFVFIQWDEINKLKKKTTEQQHKINYLAKELGCEELLISIDPDLNNIDQLKILIKGFNMDENIINQINLLLHENQKVKAIKVIKDLSDCDLATAKAIIDNWEYLK